MSTAPEPAAVSRFKEAHSAAGGGGRIVILPDSVHTAVLAADALGCQVGAIANSLLFDADGQPVLILTSGAHRVDTVATAERIGVPALKRAAPEFVRRHTGNVIGGGAPVGPAAPVATRRAVSLGQFDEIWAAAGHPAAVFSTTYDELLAMTGAREVEVD
jgi:prolyl-tRNA editing enzyme YbaK/EbsC (Cys-tRNA(Pro) deacylase)